MINILKFKITQKKLKVKRKKYNLKLKIVSRLKKNNRKVWEEFTQSPQRSRKGR